MWLRWKKSFCGLRVSALGSPKKWIKKAYWELISTNGHVSPFHNLKWRFFRLFRLFLAIWAYPLSLFLDYTVFWTHLSLKFPISDDRRICSIAYLAKRLMLRAITLKAIAKLTLLNPLVHTFFAPYARLSSELVASIPERILYASLNSGACCSLFRRAVDAFSLV